MKFVKLDELKIGMRLARPIYSKKGVLLFDRNSKLSEAAIESVKNFGLLGIYILEPAEPLPPMSPEDLEFERFQTMMVASISDEMKSIIRTKKSKNMNIICDQIIRKFGHLDGKINFYQNLRSKDDFVCRHELNVAILAAMITHVMNVPLEEQRNTVFTALIHDVGIAESRNEAIFGSKDRNLLHSMRTEQMAGGDLINAAFALDGPAMKRIAVQALKNQMDMEAGIDVSDRKIVYAAKVLLVANRYDEMTAMNLSGESESEVKAIREFVDHPELYDARVVNALVHSVNILFPGVSVVLSTGEKALVLTENPVNVLKPTVLSFKDNSILDLSLADNSDIYVEDVMKTLDNRYVMNQDVLKNLGL